MCSCDVAGGAVLSVRLESAANGHGACTELKSKHAKPSNAGIAPPPPPPPPCPYNPALFCPARQGCCFMATPRAVA